MARQKIKIIIDKYHDESGHEFFRVCDASDYSEPADCCSDGGWFTSKWDIDDAIYDWGKEYDIEIVKDYR